MKNLYEYIVESKPITNFYIGEIKRFNGTFAEILTYLKNNGYKDIKFFKDGAAPGNGIHRLRLKFEDNCKSNPNDVLGKLRKQFSNNYEYDLYNDEIYIHTKY